MVLLVIISHVAEVHTARVVSSVAVSAASHTSTGTSTVVAAAPTSSVATSSPAVLRTVAPSGVLDVYIGRLVVFLADLLQRGRPVVDGVLPDIVKRWVPPSHIVVHDGRVLDGLEGFARSHTVGLVLGGTAHALHVHDVLGVRVLLLAQFQHFEFLAHGRVVLLVRDDAEGAQRLLRHAVLLRVREALVLFNLSDSLLFFEAELDIVDSLVGEAHQIWRDGKAELTEADLGVRLITESPQNGIDVLLQNFLLELEQEVLYVLKV